MLSYRIVLMFSAKHVRVHAHISNETLIIFHYSNICYYNLYFIYIYICVSFLPEYYLLDYFILIPIHIILFEGNPYLGMYLLPIFSEFLDVFDLSLLSTLLTRYGDS